MLHCRHSMTANGFNKASAAFRNFESTENFLFQTTWSTEDVMAALALFFVTRWLFFFFIQSILESIALTSSSRFS